LNLLSKDRGIISYKLLFVLLFLFCILHISLKLVPMYIDAESMKDEMVTKARFAQAVTDNEIQSSLAKKAKEVGLPLGAEDFKLQRDDTTRRMKIVAVWDTELHFFFDIYPPYTVKIFHFAPIIEEDYSRKF
jgi:hypothetical protein